MKIKSMLMRLQNALGQTDLVEQMLLAPGKMALETAETKSDDAVNLVIGYNGSPNSQVALDLTLWIAHQTRLATQKQVMVHVVYVVDRAAAARSQAVSSKGRSRRHAQLQHQAEPAGRAMQNTMTLPRLEPVMSARPDRACLTDCKVTPSQSEQNLLEQADCILWQARCLAEEWRGSLEAHLRFGGAHEELRQVAEEVAADLMVVGCSSSTHELISKIKRNAPCPILGIPAQLEGE